MQIEDVSAVSMQSPSRDIMNQKSILSIRDLTVDFRLGDSWRRVVKGIDLDIAPGETLAIVGESGSGKSVTSLAIMRLLPDYASRTEGKVMLSGRNLLSLRKEQMRLVRGNEIGMVFQEPMTSLNPVFPVGKQILEALAIHRRMSRSEAKAEAIRLLDRVRLPNAKSRYNDYPHQFSGGMRQRVMIAMALACKPKLLIADEPTTALDVTIQGQILDLIKELQAEEAMAVLFITHDMGVVAEIADRTLVMYHGEAIEAAATVDVFKGGTQPYTKALLSAVPKLGSMKDRTHPERFPMIDTRAQATADEKWTTREPGEIILEVKNLRTLFDIRSGLLARKSGALHAVEDVSFTLRAGEILSLVGESGCGKSTIGRSIIRLVEPTAGVVNFQGSNILALNKNALRLTRRAIQMIFQDPYASLDPRMQVGSLIGEAFLAHKMGTRQEARDKAASLLDRVGLKADMLERYPHEFSGGQRQRIAIARALMLDPKVIIADEAVSALDVSVKAQVCNLLLDLQSQFDLAYLFISHDMAVVERVSHRVAVMYMGEIVEIGSRSAIFDNPQHPYTRKLMAAVPVPDPARRNLRRNVSSEEIKSLIRPLGYKAPVREFRQVSEGHFVQLAG